MEDEDKTKEQLVDELVGLRQRITELEALETERKRAEEALRGSEERYRSLFEGAEDHIFVVDQDFRYVAVNVSALKASGFTQEDVLGKGPYELFPEDTEFYLSQYRRAFEAEEPVQFERALELRDGLHCFSVTLSPIKDARGGVTALTGISRDITERKWAEEQLRAEKEFSESVLNAVVDTVFVFDPNTGKPLRWNKAFNEISGCTDEEIASRKAPDDWYSEKDLKRAGAATERIFQEGQATVEMSLITKDGRLIPTEYTGSLINDAEDRPQYVIAVGRDITERKQAEEVLQQYACDLELLNRASRAFGSTLDLDQVLASVLEEVRQMLDVVASSVWLIEPETDELVCQQATGLGGEIVRGWHLAPGEGIAGWVARHGESLIVPDTRADERYFRGIDRQTGLDLRSILSVPLQVKRKVIGVLEVMDTEVGRFNPIHLTLLGLLAAPAAIAIENARLFEQEREQRELAEALEEAAAAVSSTLDLDQVLDRILEQVEQVVAGDAFSVVLIGDAAGRVARWRGYELPGEEMRPSRYEIPITKYPSLMKMTQTGKPVVVQDTSFASDWVPAARDQAWRRSYVGAPIQVGGVTVGFLNVSGTRPGQFGAHDARRLDAFASHAATAIENARLYGEVQKELAERKRAEDALRESEARLELAIAGSNGGQWHYELDPDDPWHTLPDQVYLSPRLKGFIGYEDDEFPNSLAAWESRITPEDLAVLRESSQAHREGRTDMHEVEYRVRHRDGSIRWIYTRGRMQRDEHGRPIRFAGIDWDITERKRAEDQIKASLTEKEMLLKEIHHRVKNNLQVVSSLLYMQSEYIQDPQSREMLKESQERVKSMALVHEQLYQSKDLARIDFAEYIRDLATDLFRSYGVNPDAITLKINVDDVLLGVDTAIPCALIVNELVSNSLKHAFPEGRAGKIRIGFHSDDTKSTLMVSDNGVGFPEDLDFRSTQSMGLHLVITLTKQLKGAIELDRRRGTTFRIAFAGPET